MGAYDCYYHGYSGSAGGRCSDCDREREEEARRGDGEPVHFPSTQTGTMEDANRNSMGPELYKKMKKKEAEAEAEKNKKKKK
jgi:hypothetical protein